MLVSAAVTLTACGGSAARIDPAPIAPDPIVEVRREIVVTCPAELLTEQPARPQPDADAVVDFNRPGGDWLGQLIAWAEHLAETLTDARAACPPPTALR